MELRPEITLNLSSCTFREYYYLKEELVAFCRDHHLPTSGGKQELTERIACFLDSGMVKQPAAKRTVKHKAVTSEITPESEALLKKAFCVQRLIGLFSKRLSVTIFPLMFSFSNG